MANLGLVALVLNMRDGRLRQSGLLIVSMPTGRAAMLGDTPLSDLLRKDFERPGEYFIASQFGKKSVFWLPNKISSFYEAAQGYYAHGGYSVWQQELTFEPKIGEDVYLTTDFYVTNDAKIGFEAVPIKRA